ncbi:MAG: pantoate--beta-alanine ligase [Thiomicrorhabdus sp.]|nr:MAG: pantoate--beta-alanine ligase [Thiomicrorhabdus sp.]
MRVIEQVSDLRALVKSWKQAGLTVGFVPTMGNLHAGHLSLVEIAQQKCDRVIASIFVNPMQFGPDEDFDRYPRTFKEDSEKLAGLVVDAIFVPTVKEMYPNGVEQALVTVPDSITGLLEGASRPGHFDGVSTVVTKLFNMVQPDVAVFGQKDFQQLLVIHRMVEDLAMPIEVVVAPIARDLDGLALSSRNQYLTAEQRLIAPKFNTILLDISTALQSGNRQFDQLCQTAIQQLLDTGFDAVDYIQICQPASLAPSQAENNTFVILAVARLGKTRLLDNILL